jgi:hypothetical protein
MQLVTKASEKMMLNSENLNKKAKADRAVLMVLYDKMSSKLKRKSTTIVTFGSKGLRFL